MNRSSQFLSAFSVSLAVFGLIANAILDRVTREAPSEEERHKQTDTVDLSGPQPIQVDCIKKPVPIFTVYQY